MRVVRDLGLPIFVTRLAEVIGGSVPVDLLLAFVLNCVAPNFLTLVWLYGLMDSSPGQASQTEENSTPRQSNVNIYPVPWFATLFILPCQQLNLSSDQVHLPYQKPYLAKCLMFLWNTAVFHGKTSVQYFMAVFHGKTSVQFPLYIHLLFSRNNSGNNGWPLEVALFF